MSRGRHPRGGKHGHEPRAVIVSRAEQVFEMTVQGKSQREIADELGISQPGVCKILWREEERRLGHLPAERVRLLARQAARFEFIIREALKGLARSWEERQHKQQQRSTAGDGNAGERTTVKISSIAGNGNPRWAREVVMAMAEQRKLLQLTDFDWRALGLVLREDVDGNVDIDDSQLTEEERRMLTRSVSSEPDED